MGIITKDQLQVLKLITPRRIWNVVLVHVSFKLKKTWGLPYSFSIEPTTSCNLRCPECPSGLRSFTRDTGHLEYEKYCHYIDEYAPSALFLTLYFQGEPYLNPRFLDFVRYAKKKKIYVSTSTNAHYLTNAKAEETVASGIDRLIISLDGTTQETYEQYRIGGSLSKVLEGLDNLMAAKKKAKSSTPYIVLQFLVVGPNEHQLEDATALAKETGVDELKFKTAQIYDFEKGSPLIPKNEKYSRYVLRDGKYVLKHELKDECWKMWHSNVVTWDGKIVPCCFDKDAKYQMGDLNKNSLKSIWTNKMYMNFRKQLLKKRDSIDICKNCTEGAKIYE